MAREPDPRRRRAVGRAPGPTTTAPRDAMFEQLLRTVDLNALPPPPAESPEWRERMGAIDRRVSGLGAFVADAPIGWFPLLEHGAGLIPGLLKRGERLCTRQVKEKFGTLRWYAHVELVSGDWDGNHAALGVAEWAEHVSERICSLHGTADGALDDDAIWLLTLSPRAQRERQEYGVRFGQRLYPPWTHE